VAELIANVCNMSQKLSILTVFETGVRISFGRSVEQTAADSVG
jgi:hypothetical protein